MTYVNHCYMMNVINGIQVDFIPGVALWLEPGVAGTDNELARRLQIKVEDVLSNHKDCNRKVERLRVPVLLLWIPGPYKTTKLYARVGESYDT